MENFCGRKEEIDAIAELLRPRRRPGVRVVVLDGLAGSGKTTLMSEAAHRHSERFEGIVKVGLGGSTDEPTAPGDLLRQLLGRLRIPHNGLDEETLYRRYRQAMAGRHLLFLFDDAADAEQIRGVVEFPGDSVVLVTSRVELSGLPASARISVGSFREQEALELLGAEVGAQRVAAEPDAARRIVRRCGHLPLAIHLVGGRIGDDSRSPATLAELNADLAAAGLDGIAARETDSARASARTMREIFDGIHRRLDPELRRMFRLMGGDLREFDVPTAAALADVPERHAAELLRNLHARRLVELVETRRARYRLHDLLRQFAQELAAEDPAEIAAAVHRLSALRLRQVEGLVAEAQHGVALGGSAAAEQVHHASRHGDHETCWRLVAALAELYELTGFPADWPALHAYGTAAAQALGCDQARTAMLLAEGTHRSYHWRWTELLDLLRDFEATESATNLMHARVLTLRSRAYAAVGDPGRALPEAQRALSYGGEDRRERIRALVALGEAYRTSGRLEESAARLTQAVEHAETVPVERSRALHALAATLTQLGRADAAAPALSDAVEIDRARQDMERRFAGLVRLADLHRRRPGGRRPALALLEQARRLSTVAGEFRRPRGGLTADALLTMAECYLDLGQLSEADDAWNRANLLEVTALEARRLVVRAALALAEGRPAEAAQALEPVVRAGDSGRTAEERPLRARAAVLLGDAYGGLEDHAGAAAYYEYAERLGGEGTGRVAEARAAAAGSWSARAAVRRRTPLRWPPVLVAVLAVLCVVPALSLLAHDGSGIRVTPLSNGAALLSCALAALLAPRLRPYGAGVLIGCLSPVPTALGVVLITSEQVRARGTVGMVVDCALAAAVVAVTAWRPRRAPSVLLVSLLVIEVGGTQALPALWSEPVAANAWDTAGIALIVLGIAWPAAVVLRHPAVHPQTTVGTLLLAVVAGGALALLLGFGLGRQTYMLWPGHPGSDWRLALLGLSTAVTCACAGLVGPARLSSGMLGGLAWFWGIHAVLLGMAHAETDAPNFWADPARYREWLSGSSHWVWILPSLCLLVVMVLGGVSGALDDHSPRLAHGRPPLPLPDGLAERLRIARRARLRLYGAGVLAALGGVYALSYVAALAGSPAAEGAREAAVLGVVACLGLAAVVHPDIGVRKGVRRLGVAALISVATGFVVVNVRQIESYGWSRGAVAGLMAAAAALFAIGSVAPYRTIPVPGAQLDRDRVVTACTWAAAVSFIGALVTGASGLADVLAPLVGAVVGGGTVPLFAYLRRRRAADGSHDPPTAA